MKSLKYFEGASYFYGGTLLILLLDYSARVTGSRFGYNFAPEVGLGPEILLMFGVTVVYYSLFLMIQFGLSRCHRPILDARNFLPASFAAGIAVGFTFIMDFDFLFWIFYQKDLGTIFGSVLAVEILFLLINFAIIWRTSRA